MTLTVWAAYASFVFLYMLTPGPSHLLMMSNAMHSGFKRATACAAGDLSANTLQILVAGLGISLAVQSDTGLLVVKGCGIAYLIYVGIKMLRRGRSSVLGTEPVKSYIALFFEGFMTSAINPKAIIFFAALLPQFIAGTSAFWPQLLVLGATYILIDGSFLMLYGAGADKFSKRLGTQSLFVIYLPGIILILTALILAYRVILMDFNL